MGSTERTVLAARPWAAIPADVVTLIRPALQDVSAAITEQVVAQLPDRVRMPGVGLGHLVDHAVRHFTGLLADPRARGEEHLAVYREIGAAEAAAGRTLALLESAVRTGAHLAWQRIVAESQLHGLGDDVQWQLLDSLLAFTSLVNDAAREGHRQMAGRADDGLARRRRRLVGKLLGERPVAPDQLTRLARVANWPVPGSVAVAVLQPPATTPARRPRLPPGLLADLDRRTPCVVLPGAGEPADLRELREHLGDWTAVVGPAVRPQDAARSQRWALEALGLIRRGVIPADRIVRCADHVPTLVIFQAEEFLETTVTRRLSALLGLAPNSRDRLSETLLVLLHCNFNATKAAAQLNVHPQTVRYRLHKLEEIFGSDLQNHSHDLELQMLLHAKLAGARAAGDAGARAPEPATGTPPSGRPAAEPLARPGAPGRAGPRVLAFRPALEVTRTAAPDRAIGHGTATATAG
ncbi:PucR family transcriptional regulator [Actinomadura scrupuli]|uniref:PucR family transcriptional regulator n=1 Tax=Actinomadura scrupuli TaxID=559629 RepID=UPI003D95CC9E